jgi:succinyl-CoA synthetase alpha subunit
MKKRILLVVAVALLVCATAYAQSFVNSSGSKTATAAIFGEAGKLHGIVVSTDGTNAQTIDIYDNTTNSGTKLIPTWIVTTSATDRTQSLGFYPPVNFSNGCYVVVSGSGAMSYVVYYSR